MRMGADSSIPATAEDALAAGFTQEQISEYQATRPAPRSRRTNSKKKDAEAGPATRNPAPMKKASQRKRPPRNKVLRASVYVPWDNVFKCDTEPSALCVLDCSRLQPSRLPRVSPPSPERKIHLHGWSLLHCRSPRRMTICQCTEAARIRQIGCQHPHYSELRMPGATLDLGFAVLTRAQNRTRQRPVF